VREYWQVDPQVARYSERPKLWDAIRGLSDEVWPEYNQHGHTLNHYWAQIYDVFREWQFVLYDPGDQAVLAQGHTVPLAWDRRPPWRRAEQPVLLWFHLGRPGLEVAPDHARRTRPEGHPAGPARLGRAKDAARQALLDREDPAVQIRQPQRRQFTPPWPAAAARWTSTSNCSAANKRRARAVQPGRRWNASCANAAASPAAASRRPTSSRLWWRRGWGRGGPRIPASGFSRRKPSAAAQDTAPRSSSQRADTFGTDTPASRHRQIAVRITAGVSDCTRQRHSGSPTRVETT
jgi:hypothetical protein